VTRRLGERAEYRQYTGTLGKAVHNDYHAWTLPVADDPFEQDAPTEREPLPAGPQSSWVAHAGGPKPDPTRFPYESLLDQINRRGHRGEELARVKDAWQRLREWEPNGEVLYRVVYVDCLCRPVRLGWKHRDKKFYEARVRAWEIIAVQAVEEDVLARAVEAGAVDERALAWARGLLRAT
jgi:hypothetical protein